MVVTVVSAATVATARVVMIVLAATTVLAEMMARATRTPIRPRTEPLTDRIESRLMGGFRRS
jgi:hypothetical protein